MSEKKVTLLCSGGLDSTAMVHFYKQLGYEITLLFISYGQQASRKELTAVKGISRHYEVPYTICWLKSAARFSYGVINGRNLFFLATALMTFTSDSGQIAIGIHNGTDYPDCSVKFTEYCDSIFNIYTKGAVAIAVPFISWSKSEIFRYCIDNLVPIHLTYSCELGLKQPCDKCPSCQEINQLNETYNK